MDNWLFNIQLGCSYRWKTCMARQMQWFWGDTYNGNMVPCWNIGL